MPQPRALPSMDSKQIPPWVCGPAARNGGGSNPDDLSFPGVQP